MNREEYKAALCLMAIECADLGILGFPIHGVEEDRSCACRVLTCTDIGKHPLIKQWQKKATRDHAQIRKWIYDSGWDNINWALVMGEISNATALDIDVGPGKGGAETWVELNAEHGEPITLKARTGSGGFHVLFKYNSALKTASNVLGKGVDCRNDGGYIVAAPSRHRSGGVYEWLNWGTPLAPLPAHLAHKKDNRGRPKKDDLYRGRYTIEQAKIMLESVSAADRDTWRYVGIILGREFKRSDEAWVVYCEWAATYDGQKGRGHDAIMHQCFYELSLEMSEKELSMGTIVKLALEGGWVPTKGQVPKDKFVYYTSGNNFIYRPTGSEWIASAVDVAVSPINVEGKLVKASVWIQTHQLVTSITCDPGLDADYVKGFDCRNGERIESEGAALFNTYRTPTLELGDAGLAGPWRDHVFRVMDKPGDADQFLNYMAHRVQKPWEKPRFALLIAGGQGIGKDTAIEMCVPAIGAWNAANVDPGVFDTAYNDYVCSTLVRISETSNLQDMSKWAFNERTKVLIAGTPDVCRVNPKYGEQFSIRMYCGVILTTNNLAAGIYIPQDDRRYDVIECASLEEMKLSDEVVRRDYFATLWDWFLADGAKHVAAFLHDRKLDGWSPSNGQRKTAAHREVVAVNLEADDWLDDILDGWEYPNCVRADWIFQQAINAGEHDKELRRKFGPTMNRAGYVKHLNPEHKKDGRWRDSRKKLVRVYRKRDVVLTKEDLLKLLNPVNPVEGHANY